MSRRIRVIYVPLDDAEPRRLAWEWLRSFADSTAERIDLDDLDTALDSLPDVVWIDAHDPPPPHAAFARLMDPGSRAGLLLTGGAVALPSLLGIEPVAPNDRIDRRWRDADDELFLFDDFAETPRIRGHAAFRRHRLFEGLGGGVYTWWPHDGDAFHAITYRSPSWPATAGAVAVERAFIHVNPDRVTIWEYAAPRILCIGAYLPFESRDPLFRPHLERLAGNALRYLATPDLSNGRNLHWHRPEPRTIHEPALSAPPPARFSLESLPLDLAPLLMTGNQPDDPFTLAGRRTLAAGFEGTGVAEVWMHPLRVMKDVSLHGATFERAVVTSLGIERHLTAAGMPLVERLHVPREVPGFVIEWALAPSPDDEERESGEATVELEWETDLRLMWPYPAGSLGPLHWQSDERTLIASARRTGESVRFVIQAPDSAAVRIEARDASTSEAPRLHCSVHAVLSGADPIRLVVAAAVGSGDDSAATCAALRNPAARVRAQAAALRRTAREELGVTSPDPAVDQALEWAKHRLDSFIVDVPDLGRSLVAGYWTSRPGWNDGRPGYAWFFGRDAVWTAFACLATGNFDAARDTLTFLAAYQDLNGKILHECTTSGSVHYDAADSTPLWLLLVARYFAWTGDIAFVRSLWPRVRHALDFCSGTDTDGDGIIENTRVGHGWIEFGRLGGGRATFYNAGIWCAALRELAAAAESIGEPAAANDLRDRHRTARASLESRFWDPDRNRYALRIDPTDFTPTATHAVPLLLGEVDPGRAAAWLESITSDEFTTPWGVRMLPASEPGFKPDSYHGGAVWPLYTGWASWAEYAAGRSQSAFDHWRSNLDLAFERAKGAWDEVLHGTERRSVGVCPDQAWSTAMAVCPLVYGLLGAVPDAVNGRLRIRPQIPLAWDHLEVRNLRLGEASIRLRYRRTGATHTFALEQEQGPVPIRLILEPALPGRFLEARVDGEPARLNALSFGERLIVPLQIVLDHVRIVEIEFADPVEAVQAKS